MKARLAHLTGGRVGEAAIIWKSCAMLGRSPEADVRFGPDGDRMVAGRHASLTWHEGVWLVRDLGSANGTYVDGSRVHGETALRDGSIIQLGRDGPQVRFSIVWEADAPEPVRTVDVDAVGDPDALRPVPHIPVILSRPDHDEPPPSTPSGRPRRVAASLVLVIAALGGISLARAGPSDAPEALRLALLARADSVFAALEGIPGTAPGLRSAVSETQSRVALMRGRVRRAPADPVVFTTLRDSLGLLAARGRRLAGAACDRRRSGRARRRTRHRPGGDAPGRRRPPHGGGVRRARGRGSRALRVERARAARCLVDADRAAPLPARAIPSASRCASPCGIARVASASSPRQTDSAPISGRPLAGAPRFPRPANPPSSWTPRQPPIARCSSTHVRRWPPW
jgi:pSer/pThr/pTyr-binding forkhead associated (FHA) protein